MLLSGEAAESGGRCGGGHHADSTASSSLHVVLASVSTVFHSDVPR